MSLRAYRLLLRAYPRAFRREFAAEMEAIFEERYVAARRRGSRAVASLWLRSAWDTLANSVPERLEQWRDLPPQPSLTPPKGGLVDTLAQDLRYSVRSLAARPGFAAVTILTIAIGIGANAAIFGVVNAVLIEPLPFPAAERLVIVWGKTKRGPLPASWPEYVDWREQTRSFEEMGVWRRQSVNLTGREAPIG
jgi:hypothetical protein